MTETLIVNGVVIANGVADSDGDILDKKDIKTIFMKYQRDTDTMHKNIKNDGVEVFASWISEVDSTIAGKLVPEGSWLATLKVTNPKLVECINQGKLNGFSLGSVSKEAMTPKYWFINKSLNYRDIKDIEDVIPLFISFVDKPANQYGFEIMSYDAYINKNEKDVKMTDVNDEMISVSALEKIKGLFSIDKAEEEQSTEETVEEPSADETVTALFEKLDTIIEQNNQILEATNKAEEEEDESVDEEEEIEKAEEETKEEEENEPSEEEEDDVEIEKSETEEETEEESESSEEEADADDDVEIEKRQTSMIENNAQANKNTFYQNTGRDHLGRKIRN